MTTSIKYLFNKNGKKINNCVVVNTAGVSLLFSYEYLIASVEQHEDSVIIKRYTNFVSNTTSRHIKAFFEDQNVDVPVKQFYERFPLTEDEE